MNDESRDLANEWGARALRAEAERDYALHCQLSSEGEALECRHERELMRIRAVDAEAKLAEILEFVEQDARQENAGHHQAPTDYAQGVRDQAAFTRGMVAGIVNNNEEN